MQDLITANSGDDKYIYTEKFEYIENYLCDDYQFPADDCPAFEIELNRIAETVSGKLTYTSQNETYQIPAFPQFMRFKLSNVSQIEKYMRMITCKAWGFDILEQPGTATGLLRFMPDTVYTYDVHKFTWSFRHYDTDFYFELFAEKPFVLPSHSQIHITLYAAPALCTIDGNWKPDA